MHCHAVTMSSVFKTWLPYSFSLVGVPDRPKWLAARPPPDAKEELLWLANRPIFKPSVRRLDNPHPRKPKPNQSEGCLLSIALKHGKLNELILGPCHSY
jgi:hypothetical protein